MSWADRVNVCLPDPPREPWSETEPRMYSAGYQEGKRLAHVAHLARRSRETDEHLIRLGANAYAEGFEDGHAGRPPRFTVS